MLATVIVLPVVLLACWLIIQAALVAHASHLAQAAAQDAADAAATGNVNSGQIAEQIMAAGNGIATDIHIATSSDQTRVTVTVTAHVIQIVPGKVFTVTQTASAPREGFTPQTQRP